MTTTTTGQNPIWDLQSQYLPEAFKQAEKIYFGGAPAYYPGETVAGFDPVRAAGINQGVQAAYGPQQQLADAHSQGILDIARGTDPATQRLAEQAGGAVNAAYAGAGTLGSARNQLAANAAAGDVIAKRQLDALSQIPSAQQSALAPAQTLSAAGKGQQDYQQRLIDADKQRYDYQQNLPSNWLNQWLGAIGTPGWSAPTSTSVASPSGFSAGVDSGLQNFGSSLIGNIGSSLIGGLFAEGGEVPAGTPKVSKRYMKVKQLKMARK